MSGNAVAGASAPSSAASTIHIVPPTTLPTDPNAVARYLHGHNLTTLQSLYRSQLNAHDAAYPGRRDGGRRGRGSKRRRGTSPATSHREEEERAQRLEEDEVAWEVRRAAGRGLGIDEAHFYELGYMLEPESGSDNYYYGHHPKPPSRVTRSVLAETRLMFDPKGIDNETAYNAAVKTFNMEENLGQSLERTAKGVPAAFAVEDWELASIARFSSSCHVRIARGLLKQKETSVGTPSLDKVSNPAMLSQDRYAKKQMGDNYWR